MKSMQRNADTAYQLSIWCGAEERYGIPLISRPFEEPSGCMLTARVQRHEP
jgi:hypothetical protein